MTKIKSDKLKKKNKEEENFCTYSLTYYKDDVEIVYSTWRIIWSNLEKHKWQIYVPDNLKYFFSGDVKESRENT